MDQRPLVDDLVRYLWRTQPGTTANPGSSDSSDAGLSKKRKLAVDASGTGEAVGEKAKGQLILALLNVSFQMPRKKLDLVVFQQPSGGIQLLLLNSNEKDALKSGSVSCDHAQVQARLGQRWIESAFPATAIDFAFLLPTPGKVKAFYSAVWVLNQAVTGSESHVVFGWGADEGLTHRFQYYGSTDSPITRLTNLKDQYRLFCEYYLHQRVSEPEPSDFQTAAGRQMGQSTGNEGDKFAVRCHVKAKEGLLYFLREGIFFGFKKPIIFMKHDAIENIDVRSITSRTFDIAIVMKQDATAAAQTAPSSSATTKTKKVKPVEYEFQMIDHAEFDAFTLYLQKYRSKEKKANSSVSTAKNNQHDDMDEIDNPLTIGGRDVGEAQRDAMAFTQRLLADGSGDDDDVYDSEEDEDFVAGASSSSDVDSSEISDSGEDSQQEDDDDDEGEEEEDEEDDDGNEEESLGSRDTDADSDAGILSGGENA